MNAVDCQFEPTGKDPPLQCVLCGYEFAGQVAPRRNCPNGDPATIVSGIDPTGCKQSRRTASKVRHNRDTFLQEGPPATGQTD